MELIRLAAKKTVAQMLQRDSFKKRLQADIDVYMHEFLYPLMQGYDSVMVKSDIELGGTDQTFNNLVGRDIQRAYGQKAQIVMIMPILVGLDGTDKMSKSKGNYIGVTNEPSDIFGKVMSISDDMMENYFTLLTNIQPEEIAELTDPAKTHPKEAKVLLAKTIVTQFHDEEAARRGAAEFEKVMDLFDHVIASSDVGVRKPAPRFYAMACEIAKVEPGQVVFLDDLGINLKPARAMGMTTIKVTNPQMAIKDLEAILGISLS